MHPTSCCRLAVEKLLLQPSTSYSTLCAERKELIRNTNSPRLLLMGNCRVSNTYFVPISNSQVSLICGPQRMLLRAAAWASGTLPAPDIWLLCYHWLIRSREATLVTPGTECPGKENYQHILSGLEFQSGPQISTGVCW